jgi:hypothetical protein
MSIVIENGAAAAKVPAHKFDRQPAAHHHASGVRIDPDVVFRGRGDISFAARRSAHDHAAADLRNDLPVSSPARERHVGERPERDQHNSGIRLNGR